MRIYGKQNRTDYRDIQQYLDGCKYLAFSNNKIIVNKDDLDGFFEELKASTPEEIKRYQKIISNREAILSDAKKKAEALLQETSEKSIELVNETEIMRQAYEKANEVVINAQRSAQNILDTATMEANEMRSSMVQYADQLLESIEALVTKATNDAAKNYESLIADLNSCNAVVRGNRIELQKSNGDDDDLEAIEFTESDGSGNLGGPDIM